MRHRIDRYLLSEVTGPLALGLAVYSFILLLQQFFRLVEMIIRRGVPAATVAELLGYLVPSVLVLTLPMALLLAVLLGVGRLASDSELVALRATGMSLYRLLWPLLAFATFLGGINAYLMSQVLPQGNSAFRKLTYEIAARTLGDQFEPRVFYNEFQGKVLYVFDIDPASGAWNGVFLADAIAGSDRPTDVIIADHGRLELSADGEQVIAILDGAVQHTYDLARPDRYETRRYEHLRLLLRDRLAAEHRRSLAASVDFRSLTWAEADAIAQDPASPPMVRAAARVQMHKMIVLPAACPVFALLALPLAFNNRRGGKSSGFALSIGIVTIYYVLITQVEQAAITGEIPVGLAMWLPNLLFASAGLLLLVVKNRDRSLIPGFVTRSAIVRSASARLRRIGRATLALVGVRRRSPRPPGSVIARAAAPTNTRVVVRLPRLRLRFPNLIDRYVLTTFFLIFFLVLASAVALLVITDFSESVDDMLASKPSLSVVLRLYKYLALQLAYNIAPIAVLVTSLVTFSLLSRTNEVTACRALGVSIFRLALPAFVAAIAIGGLFAALEAKVLPASNQKVAEARSIIKGRPLQRFSRSADRQWQIGAGRFMYNFLHFDEKRSTLQRLQVFEFDSDSRLRARLFAEEAKFSGNEWVLARGWARTFSGREQIDYRSFPEQIAVDLAESPGFFAEEVRQPSQMTFAELSQYVAELRDSGRPQPRYEVSLHNKVAFPVGSIVLALVGFPFAFRIQKHGALYGLGIAVAVGFAFILVHSLFRTLGEVGALPAAIAVWSPSALFSMFAAYLFLGVRS